MTDEKALGDALYGAGAHIGVPESIQDYSPGYAIHIVRSRLLWSGKPDENPHALCGAYRGILEVFGHPFPHIFKDDRSEFDIVMAAYRICAACRKKSDADDDAERALVHIVGSVAETALCGYTGQLAIKVGIFPYGAYTEEALGEIAEDANGVGKDICYKCKSYAEVEIHGCGGCGVRKCCPCCDYGGYPDGYIYSDYA